MNAGAGRHPGRRIISPAGRRDFAKKEESTPEAHCHGFSRNTHWMTVTGEYIPYLRKQNIHEHSGGRASPEIVYPIPAGIFP